MALIVGGHDRGLDYAPLARAIDSSSPQPVVFWIGDAGAGDRDGPRRHLEPRPTPIGAVARGGGRASRLVVRDIASSLFSPASPTPRDEGTYLDRSQRFRQVAGIGEGHSSRVGTP